MLNNLLKEYYLTKSPHLLISQKWFYRIKSNIVLMKSPCECTNGKNSLIFYEIEHIGKNVRYFRKGERLLLNPSATRQNEIFVVVRISDMDKLSKLQFHTDKGHMIDMLDVDHKKDQCYVLLSIVQINKNCQKS